MAAWQIQRKQANLADSYQPLRNPSIVP